MARVLSVHEKGALARPSMPCRAKPRLRPVTFTKCSMPAADSLTATGAVVLGRPTATARRLVNASLSDNTRRAYAGALGQIDAWLDGRRSTAAAWPPTSPSSTTPAVNLRIGAATSFPKRQFALSDPPGTAARPCVREPPRKVCVRGAKGVRPESLLRHESGRQGAGGERWAPCGSRPILGAPRQHTTPSWAVLGGMRANASRVAVDRCLLRRSRSRRVWLT